MGSLANRNTFLIDPKGVIRKVYLNVNPIRTAPKCWRRSRNSEYASE